MTREEQIRYSRTVMLDGVGTRGQERLLGATVAIVGAGALGTVCAMYLSASGVGTIRLADFDTIDLSNLQRQLSFTAADCGRPKAEVLAERLRAINPQVRVEVTGTMLRSTAEAAAFMQGATVVVEGSDNPATKYLVARTAQQAGVTCVIGGVAQWQAQVMSWRPGTAAYHDLFPEAAEEGAYMPCSLGGVLGPLPGITGSMMAAEVIKIITGAGTPLFDKLWTLDLLTMRTSILTVNP